MEIPKTYDPSEVEDKWYKYWMEKEFFKSVPDEQRQKDAFTLALLISNLIYLVNYLFECF